VLCGGSAIAGIAILRRSAQAIAPGCGVTSGASGKIARPADSAASVPGINTHINYLRSTYAKSFSTITKPRLIELGVRYIRDNPGGPSDRVTKGRFIELARAGITVLFAASDTDDRLSYVKALNGSGVRVVDAVEPPNERDNAWGSAMPSRMRDCMISLYTRYRADAATRGITILGPSFANTRDSANKLRAYFPTAANYMTVGNAHSYPGGREPDGRYGGGWGITLADALARQRMGSSKPVWASECGYKLSGSRSGHYAVTQRAAAKYMGRVILSHLSAGAPRLYKYQLINDNSENFALLNNDGSPRQQFLALRNFMRLFADPGPDFEPGTLAYSWSGSLTGIKEMLFQKRSGAFYLVVWQAVASSTVTTADSGVRDVEPARRSLTLNLGMRMQAATVYEPAFSPDPVRRVTSGAGLTSLSLQVPDHIQVVELVPSACGT
jgi:hypothetical protein